MTPLSPSPETARSRPTVGGGGGNREKSIKIELLLFEDCTTKRESGTSVRVDNSISISWSSQLKWKKVI